MLSVFIERSTRDANRDAIAREAAQINAEKVKRLCNMLEKEEQVAIARAAAQIKAAQEEKEKAAQAAKEKAQATKEKAEKDVLIARAKNMYRQAVSTHGMGWVDEEAWNALLTERLNSI